VNQTPSEKEAMLKELVIKLLKEKNLSDYEKLESLFDEIKEELKTARK